MTDIDRIDRRNRRLGFLVIVGGSLVFWFLFVQRLLTLTR